MVSVVLLPKLIVAEPAMIGDGAGLIVTVDVAAVLDPQLFVAVSVYTPADTVPTVIAVGLRSVAV